MVKDTHELASDAVAAAPPNAVGIRAAKKALVGFIGLGRMGSAMAANLAAAGYRVTAYVRHPDQMNNLAARTNLRYSSGHPDYAVCGGCRKS